MAFNASNPRKTLPHQRTGVNNSLPILSTPHIRVPHPSTAGGDPISNPPAQNGFVPHLRPGINSIPNSPARNTFASQPARSRTNPVPIAPFQNRFVPRPTTPGQDPVLSLLAQNLFIPRLPTTIETDPTRNSDTHNRFVPRPTTTGIDYSPNKSPHSPRPTTTRTTPLLSPPAQDPFMLHATSLRSNPIHHQSVQNRSVPTPTTKGLVNNLYKESRTPRPTTDGTDPVVNPPAQNPFHLHPTATGRNTIPNPPAQNPFSSHPTLPRTNPMRKLSSRNRIPPPPSAMRIHSPLQGPDSIRLLDLEPGSHGDPIICSLKVTTIDDISPYYAISYVWGEPNFTSTVTCNGKKQKITGNLHDALNAVRCQKKTLVIWADAICIDQSNLEERSHQVKHMSAIFRRAKRVLVWLGHDEDGVAERVFDRAPTFKSWSFGRDLDSPKMKKALEDFRTLSQWPWFTRMWTCQEIALASSATIMCGQRRIAWDILWKAYCVCTEQWGSPKDVRRIGFDPERVSFLNQTFLHESCSFLELLNKTRLREASDPRDKIFALLSHPSAQINLDRMDKIMSLFVRPTLQSRGLCIPFMTADYTKRLQQVNCEAAKAIIRQMGNLNVLSYVFSDDLDHVVASWAPRWDTGLPYSHRLWTPSCKYNAGIAELSMSSSSPFVRLHNYRLLGLQGYFLDTIETCSQRFHKETGWSFEVPSIWRATENKAYAKYGNAILHAWQAVLTGDRSSLNHNRSLSLPFTSWWASLEWGLDDAPHIEYSKGWFSVRHKKQIKTFIEAGWIMCKGRRFFCTTEGYVGLGPHILKKEDRLFIADGAKVPFIVRPSRKGFRLVGECYVAGLMQGELNKILKHNIKDNSPYVDGNLSSVSIALF